MAAARGQGGTDLALKRQLAAAAALVLAAAAAAAAQKESVNVKDFGAKGDGLKNDSAAIQKALDAAGKDGGEVFLPAGRYRLNSGLKVPAGVTLSGTWQAPHHAEHRKGTILLGYAGKGRESGEPLIHLSPNSAVKGITIFYPEQKLPKPFVYPWTIQGEGMHCSVMDVTLVNVFKGIDIGEKPNELHYIRNVFGCPLKAGVHIDKCTDIGRIENVHFNPHYWARSGEAGIPKWEDLLAYIYDNCVAFAIGRSDWEFISNTFSYGCKVGYRFYKSEAGACNGNFPGIAADWSRTCVLVEETQGAGLLITNGEFVGGTGSEAMIDVRPSCTGVTQLSNCAFWGPAERCLRIAGSGFMSVSQGNFVNWDPSAKQVPCVEALGGEINIANSFFREDKKQILLGESVKTAVITGNRFQGEARIENNSKGDVQISGNVVNR